jgi:hypothetical protein
VVCLKVKLRTLSATPAAAHEAHCSLGVVVEKRWNLSSNKNINKKKMSEKYINGSDRCYLQIFRPA